MANHHKQPTDFIEPLGLVAVGTLLLLNTTGVVAWEIWGHMIRFWPALLILWGLEVIFAQRNAVAKNLLSLLGILLFVAVALYGYNAIQTGAEPINPFIIFTQDE